MKRALLISLTLCALPLRAQAAPSSENQRLAQQSFAQAEAAFARREYTAAAAAFEQAGRFVPHPSSFLNAAEAWELAGEWLRAADDCDQARGLPSASPALRAEAEKRLERLAKRIGKVELSGPSGLVAQVDGGLLTSVPGRRWVAPGRHTVVAKDRATDQRQVFAFEVQAGAVAQLDLSGGWLPGVATSTPTGAGAELGTSLPAPAPGPPLASWVAFGTAGAATLGALVFGGLTFSAQSSYNDAPSRDAADTFYDSALITNLALGTAVLAVGVGVVLWYVDAD